MTCPLYVTIKMAAAAIALHSGQKKGQIPHLTSLASPCLAMYIRFTQLLASTEADLFKCSHACLVHHTEGTVSSSIDC